MEIDKLRTQNLDSHNQVSVEEDVPIVVKDLVTDIIESITMPIEREIDEAVHNELEEMVTETIVISNSVQDKKNFNNFKELSEDSAEEDIDLLKVLLPPDEILEMSDDSFEEPFNTSPKKQQVLASNFETSMLLSPDEVLEMSNDSFEEPINTSPKKQQVLASNFESSVQKSSTLSTDENKRTSSTKELLKESISLPYHEEHNNNLQEFANGTTSHAADDEKKILDNNKVVLMNRERFRPYKLLNQVSNSIKKTSVSYRDFYKQNLKEEITKKKEEYFDKLKKVQQADEEMIEAEYGEILEADDEDSDSDCSSPSKIISPIKSLKGKKTTSSSDTRKSSEHFQSPQEHDVYPSYQQPKLSQDSQYFSSQESVDINMICSGRFPDTKTNGQSQPVPWSPPSQRKIIENESDDDVIFVCEEKNEGKYKKTYSSERKQVFPSPASNSKKASKSSTQKEDSSDVEEYETRNRETDSFKRKRAFPSPASNSKKASKGSTQKEDSSDVEEYETRNKETDSFKRKRVFPSPASNSKKASKSSTQKEDSSDGEDGIKPCAKKCRVLTYLSEEESEKDNSIPENSFVSPNMQRDSSESTSEKSLTIKNKNDFLDLEAQLDSNEEATSDESESEITEEINDLIDDVKDNEINHEELAIIHHKKTLEEDARAVKNLQEKYLPGGDLHDDGKGRQRKFLWGSNEGNTIPIEITLSDSEQDDITEASVSQEKAIWRQKSTMVQKSDSETENLDYNEKNSTKLPVQIVGKESNSQLMGTPAYKATSSTTPKVRQSGSFMALRKTHQSSQGTPNAGLMKNLFINKEKKGNQQDRK